MALTLFEAAKQSQNELTAGVLLAIATSDEMISQLPMVRKGGESFVYNREKSLPTANWVSPTHSSLSESSADFDRVTVPMRLIVDDVDTFIFAEQQQSDLTAQRGLQITQKLKATGRTIALAMVEGGFASGGTMLEPIAGVVIDSVGPLQDSDRHGPGELFFDFSASEIAYRAPGDRVVGAAQSTAGDPTLTLVSDNPNRYIIVTITTASLPGADASTAVTIQTSTNQPDGLRQLVDPALVTASAGANGDALSFDTLDVIIDAVKTETNKFLVMNSALRRKYLALMRGLGGTEPGHVMLPGINGPVPTYRGHPILRNDNIPSTESKGASSTLSSVYCVDMNPVNGFYAGVGGQGVETAALTPMDVRIMGVQVRDIGELEDKEAMRARVSWYGAFALGSSLALARASEIETV